jgi:lauroyl/myristoyl acyltransferase
MVSGAPMLPSFILRDGDRYRIVIEDPLPIARSGDNEADLRVNVERFVRILESYVRRYPTQWYCFYPFWDDPSRKVPPGAAEGSPPRGRGGAVAGSAPGSGATGSAPAGP